MFSWFRRKPSEVAPSSHEGAALHGSEERIPDHAPKNAASESRFVAKSDSAMDYLATPSVAAYFDAREHEAYYRALKRVGGVHPL